MNHKIQISRGTSATQPSTERHFNEQISRYGKFHIINLLGQKEGEAILSQAYRDQVKYFETIAMTDFDFNAKCKNGSYENVYLLLKEIQPLLEEFGYFVFDSVPVLQQTGVFRVNCVDWYPSVFS